MNEFSTISFFDIISLTYIDYTPYNVTYSCNVYYITMYGACEIILPPITSVNDGFYLYFRRVYADDSTIHIYAGPDLDTADPSNIVSEGQYIADAVFDYQCQLVGAASIRTFRVGTITSTINGTITSTINGTITSTSYWFVNTA